MADDMVRLRTTFNCDCFLIERLEPDGKVRKSLARLGRGFWASARTSCSHCKGTGKKTDTRVDDLRELWDQTYSEEHHTPFSWMVQHDTALTHILSHGKVGTAFLLLDQFKALGEHQLKLCELAEDVLADAVIPGVDDDEGELDDAQPVAQEEG